MKRQALFKQPVILGNVLFTLLNSISNASKECVQLLCCLPTCSSTRSFSMITMLWVHQARLKFSRVVLPVLNLIRSFLIAKQDLAATNNHCPPQTVSV
jgi:hypothetical protein